MKLHVKNMVCDRCKLVIQNILDDMDVPVHAISLGEIDLGERSLDDEELISFTQKIEAVGFELIGNRKSRLIAEIRESFIELIQNAEQQKVKLSDYLADKLHHDYGYLSHLFSSVEGITIEQAFILQKVEKAKELLVYDELTLTEISHRLGYSSVAHLSRQFKQITGLTPTAFKKMRGANLRRSIDQLN
tara:strand:+ start:13543 stop:14109 length:567 start_codon:yes stop_codon:yes gene_type:complete